MKLKSGGAGEGGVELVFALAELDVVVDDVEVALEEVEALEVVALDAVLEVVAVLVEEAFCVDLG